MRFYLLVSIYENMLFQRFSSFLTAGNKSYCGTLQHLTHPQQSTDSPIPEPVSSSKRQASQRKPFALSSTHAQTSSRLRKHRTSVPSAPVDPMHTLPKVARNSATRKFNTAHKRCNPNGLVSMFERFTRELRATFFGNPALRPLSKSHVIPPRPHSVTAQRPRNINDPISKPETPSGELRAKLQHLRPLAGPVATPHGGHRAQAATHPDR